MELEAMERVVASLELACYKIHQKAVQYTKFEDVVGRYMGEVCSLEARNDILEEVLSSCQSRWS
jgi:hypothetical protein